MGYLSAAALFAWSVPPASWHTLCVRWARLRANYARQTAQARQIGRTLKRHAAGKDVERIAALYAANLHHSRLQYLRCHLYRRWTPRVQVLGKEHVESALKAGRGAVIWSAPFVFGNLIPLIAAYRQGFKVVLLSRSQHGVSGTRFGVGLLNPIFTAVENRYLGERLVMPWGRSTGVLHALCQRLRENKIVATRAIAGEGYRTFAAPFLSDTLHVACGAPVLALRSGAPLLPAFTVRAPDGSFLTIIERRLEAPQGVGLETAIQMLVEEWAQRLTPHVLRWPDQFQGWLHLSEAMRESVQHESLPQECTNRLT